MDERAPARDEVAEGWRHLRAFFREGCRHLPAAVSALRGAEQVQRRAGDQNGLVVTLVGLSLALRLSGDRAERQRAVTLAQEVVNVTRRLYGEASALPYRSHLEAAFKDLADVETEDARVKVAEAGIGACDRTVRLARRLHVPDVVPPSHAAKASLLLRLAETRASRDAARLRRQAERLYAGALDAWRERDPEGRATVQIEIAERLATHPGSRLRTERLLREATHALERGENRYLLAQAVRAQARTALASGRPEALDTSRPRPQRSGRSAASGRPGR